MDVPGVVEYAKSLQNVEYAEDLLYACSQDCMETIKQRIEEHNLNRVLVAACTPRTHEPLFRETLREAGLNQYLFEMANIRDQCSWAHMNEPELATEKAKELVEMGVAKARGVTPLQKLPVDIDPRTLVIGGGLAGMTAALALAETNYRVFLVEKEEKLGGNLRSIQFSLGDSEPQQLLEKTIENVYNNKLITVYTGTEIKTIDGYIGNFRTTIVPLHQGGKPKELQHGVVIVATGAGEYLSEEYHYKESERVVTQLEFEKIIHDGVFTGKPMQNVVMIQCVNSREEGRDYCSRLCCSQAIKNALVLKRERPAADIYVLYRDIRTYGLKEQYFGEA
ncbi:CoB--CoM heterodisulfide reductase iron-sulfur subunit A family protein, partial [candidate division WOR-3 bacterium]|nr:CoB--CoM heterodisulfide reductase iron-sulfur subunit A family protein [candidate division WOR-3 bacterium]